jgi:hypothetical protein
MFNTRCWQAQPVAPSAGTAPTSLESNVRHPKPSTNLRTPMAHKASCRWGEVVRRHKAAINVTVVRLWFDGSGDAAGCVLDWRPILRLRRAG